MSELYCTYLLKMSKEDPTLLDEIPLWVGGMYLLC